MSKKPLKDDELEKIAGATGRGSEDRQPPPPGDGDEAEADGASTGGDISRN